MEHNSILTALCVVFEFKVQEGTATAAQNRLRHRYQDESCIHGVIIVISILGRKKQRKALLQWLTANRFLTLFNLASYQDRQEFSLELLHRTYYTLHSLGFEHPPTSPRSTFEYPRSSWHIFFPERFNAIYLGREKTDTDRGLEKKTRFDSVIGPSIW